MFVTPNLISVRIPPVLNFCTKTIPLERMEKEPPQEQNKNQPPVPQENPQMDSDQQENAGEKTSDATPLGKTDPKEDEWKEHAKRIRKRYGNLCKYNVGGIWRESLMDVKAEQPGAKKLQRIFKESLEL